MSEHDFTTPLRVLHLEDNPGDADLVRHKLSAEGVSCDILVVTDQKDYETALGQHSFALILLDYNLSGYDGLRALQHAQLTRPEVPVILISGTVGDEDAVKCLHLGATDYLLKDRLDRLVPAVRRALREAEARRERRRVEAALADSEARKAAILDSVLDCIVTMDAAGVVTEFNASAARTFGYTRAEAIGRALADLIIPARFRERHRVGLAHHVASGEGRLIGRLIEVMAMRADGSEFPVELTITEIHSEKAPVFTGVLRDISARKRAEANRASLAAIVDSSDDAIFTTSLDDTVLTWNGGAERLFGYAASELIGVNRSFLVPTDQKSELAPLIARAKRGVAGEPLETSRVRKDGSVVDISLVISPMMDSAGQVISLSTIARDITSRKQAEAALRVERDRAQRYLDTPEVILLALDLNGAVTLANRYACSILGWTAGDLLGRDWIDTCVPARFRDGARQAFKNLFTGDLAVVEQPVLTRSGDERLFEWRNTLQRDDEGRVIGTFSSGADITERKRAVEALRTGEERMRFALQSANVGIWDMDYTTGVLQWSETLEAQYGLAPGTFGGTFEDFVERIHPDDRQSVLETVGRATRTGTDFSTQHRTLWPDGTVRWLSGAGRINLGEHGEPLRGVGISLDVTDARLLEAQYQQAQKMEAIGQLAAGVAHDFNNLLTVILGFCELLLEDLDPAEPRHADVVEIQRAGERAAGLTRQLLTFSRKEIIEPTLLDVNAIVANLRILLERLIGEDVEIVLALGTAVAAVEADRGQLEQIVLNLAVNARDAMPKGGRLTIATANIETHDCPADIRFALAKTNCVALRVTDTGTGMSPEVQARVFEPFFTTKAVGRGTGLGLATVHGIAARSGGTVTVESEVGKGTSFTVYLPRADSREGVLVTPLAARPQAGPRTLLLVEDADALRAMTKRLLERQGYTVLAAANAEEAQQLFTKHPSIDLLLTDVVMPGASGPDLVSQLVEQRPTLKVIYMSGYTDEAIVHHGVLDSGIEFLAKPFSSETLSRKIHDVLDR
jgi:PAS domain S-box-containing protein